VLLVILFPPFWQVGRNAWSDTSVCGAGPETVTIDISANTAMLVQGVYLSMRQAGPRKARM
jgi:hypothetical protein